MSEIEQPLEPAIFNSKIYSVKQVQIGTFLGGPLVAGYLIAANFNAFNEPAKARNTWIGSILFTVLLFGILFMTPMSGSIPHIVLPLIYSWIAYGLAQQLQGENISSYINSGEAIFSWWRLVGISLLGCVITVLLLFGVIYFSGDNLIAASQTKTYGVMKNEVSFDKSNTPENEVDGIADGLTKCTFFDIAVKKYVYVKKVNTNYEISISCAKDVTASPDNLTAFKLLRNNMQKLYPNNKIIINLVVDDLDNVVKRLE
jgi:hypothetical protein